MLTHLYILFVNNFFINNQLVVRVYQTIYIYNYLIKKYKIEHAIQPNILNKNQTIKEIFFYFLFFKIKMIKNKIRIKKYLYLIKYFFTSQISFYNFIEKIECNII